MGTTVKSSRHFRADSIIGRLLGVALILAACAGQQPSSAPASSELQSESPAPSGTSSPTTSPAPPPSDPPAAPNVIAWILDLAPGSPQGPPEFRAYRNLMNIGNDGCVALANGLQPDGGIELEDEALLLYRAVADACLAAFYEGYSDRWDSAAATFAGLAVPTSCMDVVAYRVLRELVQYHQQNPDGQFFYDAGQAEAPPCPVITQLEPDHGPPGTQVRISGFNLDHVYRLRLFFEDQFGPSDEGGLDYTRDGDALIVTMYDDEGNSLWACVVAQGAEDWNGSGKIFTFEEPGASPAATAAPLSPSAPCPPESTE